MYTPQAQRFTQSDPLKNKGITLRKFLIANCVRCSVKKCREGLAAAVKAWAEKLNYGLLSKRSVAETGVAEVASPSAWTMKEPP